MFRRLPVARSLEGTNETSIDKYLSGALLIGDDYGPEELARWYAEEKEGYAELGARDAQVYEYHYHAWNQHHAFRHLPSRTFDRVLGFGSAYGDELMPLLARVGAVTIVDPSDSFVHAHLQGVPVGYVRPKPDGILPFPDASFDLITCFGVLHHIPNVSFVVRELGRVLAKDGFIALREPIVSLGDWRYPRRGLTKRERGIPSVFLEAALQRARLRVVRKSLCDFPLVPRLGRPFFAHGVFNSHAATVIDAWLARAFAWNQRYHARTVIEKIRPTAVFIVAMKEV